MDFMAGTQLSIAEVGNHTESIRLSSVRAIGKHIGDFAFLGVVLRDRTLRNGQGDRVAVAERVIADGQEAVRQAGGRESVAAGERLVPDGRNGVSVEFCGNLNCSSPPLYPVITAFPSAPTVYV